MGEYKQRRRPNVRIRTVGTAGAFFAILLAAVALALLSRVSDVNERARTEHSNYAECSAAASDLMAASDYLTNQARLFIMTGDRAELDRYLEEVNVVDRRSSSLATLKDNFVGTRAYTALFDANAASHSLSNRELYAMRLAAEAYGIDDMPTELAAVRLKDTDKALSKKEKRAVAEEMVMGDQYQRGKDIIVSQVAKCSSELMEGMRAEERVASEELSGLLYWLRIINLALLAIVLLFLFVVFHFVISPLALCARSIGREEKLALRGAHELCIVSDAYNDMFDDISRKTGQLRHDAEYDALTGLLNRGSCDRLLEEVWQESALILVDVDHFKEINDEHGHTMGDQVLRMVAEVLREAFATDAHVCRIGGDEFSVIVLDALPVDHDRILATLRGVRTRMRHAAAGLPRVTLSCGVAFGIDVRGGRDGLYRASDDALYTVKNNGRDGIAFFGSNHIDRTVDPDTPNDQTKE